MSVTHAPRWSDSLSPAGSLAQVALRREEPVSVPRVLHDSLFDYSGDTAALAGNTCDRAVLVTPLRTRGRTIGLLVLSARSGRVFADTELTMAEDLARRAAHVLTHDDPAAQAASQVAHDTHMALAAESAALYKLTKAGHRLILIAESR